MNFRSYFTTCAILIAAALSGCSKTVNPVTPASVVVVNAIPTSNSLYVLFSKDAPKYFSNSISLGYTGFSLYSPPSGTKPVSIIQNTDTTKAILTADIPFASGGIYSLYLTGDTTHPDTLLLRDNIVNFTSDSAGVRFINLSGDSKALAINLEGGTQGDVATLSYKGVSPFVPYNADINGPGGYNFEIRDPATGDLLTTFTWYYTDHKNNSVVIAGSSDPNSPTPLTVFQVNHH